MIDLISTVAGLLYNFAIIFTVLTACAHLRDICDCAQELASVTHFMSEINRKLGIIERRMQADQPKETKVDQPKEIKAD